MLRSEQLQFDSRETAPSESRLKNYVACLCESNENVMTTLLLLETFLALMKIISSKFKAILMTGKNGWISSKNYKI